MVVLLNKCDLDPAEELYRIYTAAGFPTLRISAETGEGLEELIPLIAGKLSAFTGNSGVGKSSILNAPGPGVPAKDREISTALGRGRHTTRHVELFRLSCGAEIMDSPGFSSFETEELNLELKHRLPETFREFAPYLGSASFWIAAIPRKRAAPCGKLWKRGRSSPAGIRVICACLRN
ncbi:MAG: ribosome small subunit-dependent GTPase A [Dysosmobacter sp.]